MTRKKEKGNGILKVDLRIFVSWNELTVFVFSIMSDRRRLNNIYRVPAKSLETIAI